MANISISGSVVLCMWKLSLCSLVLPAVSRVHWVSWVVSPGSRGECCPFFVTLGMNVMMAGNELPAVIVQLLSFTYYLLLYLCDTVTHMQLRRVNFTVVHGFSPPHRGGHDRAAHFVVAEAVHFMAG